MKIYDVCYSPKDFEFEFNHARVYAENKAQARRIALRDLGKCIKINYIEVEEEL